MTSRASNGFCNCADVDNVADALLNMNGDQRSAALIRHNQTCVCDSCTYCAKLRGFSCLHSVALCDSYRDDNMLSGTMAVHNEWCPCRCYRCDSRKQGLWPGLLKIAAATGPFAMSEARQLAAEMPTASSSSSNAAAAAQLPTTTSPTTRISPNQQMKAQMHLLEQAAKLQKQNQDPRQAPVSSEVERMARAVRQQVAVWRFYHIDAFGQWLLSSVMFPKDTASAAQFNSKQQQRQANDNSNICARSRIAGVGLPLTRSAVVGSRPQQPNFEMIVLADSEIVRKFVTSSYITKGVLKDIVDKEISRGKTFIELD